MQNLPMQAANLLNQNHRRGRGLWPATGAVADRGYNRADRRGDSTGRGFGPFNGSTPLGPAVVPTILRAGGRNGSGLKAPFLPAAVSLWGLVLCEFLAAAASADRSARHDATPLSNLKYLRDHAETRGFSLGRPTKAMPTPDGQAVLFLRARARTPKLELYQFDVASGSTRLLLSPEDILKGFEEQLSAEEKTLRERMRMSLGGFTDFQLSKDGTRILLGLSGKLYLVNRATRSVQELQTGPGTLVDAKFSPAGNRVACVLDKPCICTI